jgi:hypothetical protein
MALAALVLCGLAEGAPPTPERRVELGYRVVPERRVELEYSRPPVIRPYETPRVELEVLVAGRVQPTIPYAGRIYLPVDRLETEYEIRVCNRGPRRIAAIVSVDGLSVINGQPASESHPGYLVAPHSSIVIKGWRRNRDTVAAFRFVDRENSYARLVGRPENIGVIGLIAVEEQERFPRPLLEEKDRAAPAAKRAWSAVGGTGTGYGRDVESPVIEVPFVRSGHKRTITIHYDTADALRKAGVPIDRSPVPFPADEGFVPPPPGR